MKNLYITNMRKLVKSKFYIAGLIIALVATFLFVADMLGFGGIFDSMTKAERMHFIGAAIVAFFTIYTPLFVCEEYTEGSIKNKIISGFTQKKIFLGGLLTQISALFIMWLVYIVSGIAAGARPGGNQIGSSIITLIAMFAYVTLIYSISFRLSKPIRSTILSFIILNVSFNMITFGNLMIMVFKGAALKIASVIYNICVLGQWFVYTGLGDPEANPGAVIQLLISIMIVTISVLAGLSKINTRDLA